MDDPLYFDMIEVGQRWESPRRTVTQADVSMFAGLTGDYDPLHMDHEFARNSPFGQPIAHGLLGMSFVAGLASNAPRVHTVAFESVAKWDFMRPIYFGDTVHVINEVIEKSPQGKRRGHVQWKRQLVNQKGEVVQEGIFETLVSVTPRTGATKPTQESYRIAPQSIRAS